MNAHFKPKLFLGATEVFADDDEILILDLDGYEGPLHVLLALAQRQKVDLLKLSVTRLADQYLAFVRQARHRRFALAADYLVMAAWLAYLKSRLLLPKRDEARSDETPAETVAEHLAFRLAKLDAMRRAYESMEMRPALGRDVFTRGDPQATVIVSHNRLQGDLNELMDAYVSQRRRDHERRYAPEPAACFHLDDAREYLAERLATLTAWTPLSEIAPIAKVGAGAPTVASYLASTLSAGLELVREGALETRQLEPFQELYMRAAAA